MVELKAVIFDMDGVIIDSEPIHYKLNMQLYKKLGLEISPEEYSQFVGVSNKEHWIYLMEKYEINESIDKLINIQAEMLIEYLNSSAEKPIKGVLKLLQELEREGISLALASSSAMAYIRAVLEKFSIIDYFSALISGEEMEHSKPHPGIFLKTAKSLKVKVEECLVIEDSTHGVKAAKTADMKCIAYQNPNSGNQDLSRADYIVDSLEKVDLQIMRNLFN